MNCGCTDWDCRNHKISATWQNTRWCGDPICLSPLVNICKFDLPIHRRLLYAPLQISLIIRLQERHILDRHVAYSTRSGLCQKLALRFGNLIEKLPTIPIRQFSNCTVGMSWWLQRGRLVVVINANIYPLLIDQSVKICGLSIVKKVDAVPVGAIDDPCLPINPSNHQGNIRAVDSSGGDQSSPKISFVFDRIHRGNRNVVARCNSPRSDLTNGKVEILVRREVAVLVNQRVNNETLMILSKWIAR